MSDRQPEAHERVPLAEETLSVGKRTVETGRVRIATRVQERLELIQEDLVSEEVEVSYIDIDREVAEAPQIRHEGDTLVIPIVEEVLVVEKRLVLRRELRLSRRTKVERVEEAVPLRRVTAEVERTDGSVPPLENQS